MIVKEVLLEIYVEEGYNIHVPIFHHVETKYHMMVTKDKNRADYQSAVNKRTPAPADDINSYCSRVQSEILSVAL